MNGAIKGAINDLTKAGFPAGKKLFVASHSLGTVQTQAYVLKNPNVFTAQIMMGGGITREKYVNNNSTGLTEINMIPTLSIHGTKDGLYRISRSAEGYYHQVENIAPKYKDKFPVVIVHGGSHGTFMDQTKLPLLVRNTDLMPDVTEAVGHSIVAGLIVDFISVHLGGST
jgi:pimeloyl-ACP methyl ester carboxylesterase